MSLAIGVRDRELVRRMLTGDESAFDEFFGEYFARLYRFALGRLNHDAAAAEDVAQATLCKAMRKLDTYRGEAALFTWLCTFCRHELSRHYKVSGASAAQVELLEESPEVRAALESVAVVFAGPEEAFERAEVGRLVAVALDRLPRHYASALQWKYLEGLSVKQIAERLQLSAKATESLLTRARQALRDGFTNLTAAPAARDGRPRPMESIS